MVDNIDQRSMSNQPAEFVTAREAASLLGIRLQTLYAYASRGLVRRVRSPDARVHQYARADLERLRSRREARAGHGPVAAAALRFGQPILDSTITSLTPTGPLYRGHPAVDLAAGRAPFEAVAELLWTGELPARTPRFAADGLGVSREALSALLPAGSPPLAALALAIPALAAADPARFDTRAEAVLPRARALVLRTAALLALATDPARADAALASGSVVRAVGIALGARDDAAGLRALRAGLVLCADHELNASAFAARVAASTQADVYACVSAALGTLSGPRHGGASERFEALVAETEQPERATRVVLERARRGETVPGFGHPLYPAGDPRALPLLAQARALAPRSREVRTVLALVEAMREADRGAPNLDSGLVALRAALGLPRGTAVGVFAIGRMAGWVAHVLEQYAAGFLFRPRARYLGAASADAANQD
jgi:citrate synthase